MAGADVTVSALLEQCGVLRANTIEELFDVCRALVRCPLPDGNRVGIVTNAGGPAIMATDACVNQGLRIAELADATRQHLRSFLPAEASVNNPVDMIASANADSYARTLAAVLDDPGVDMAMVINVTPVLSSPTDILEVIGEVARSRSKPVLAVMMATDEFYESVKHIRDLPPVYRFPEPAARVLLLLSRYGAWVRRPAAEEAAPDFDTDDAEVESILTRAQNGYLEPEDVFRVLDLYGIPLARWRKASSPEEALAAAQEIGYPVVLKAVAPDLVHKSDVGAVQVDLRDDRDLTEAIRRTTESVTGAGHRIEGWLVQEMAKGGHEVIFGITTDPRFGPLLMFGLGGKYVEVFQDVRFGVLPLGPADARDMVRGIRGVKLLEGVRGEAGADLELLCEILLRLAQLAQRHPRIQEVDINPFLAGPDRSTARAVDARIRVGDA
jgi:acetyltransferase